MCCRILKVIKFKFPINRQVDIKEPFRWHYICNHPPMCPADKGP